jgi:hypothetical protein
MQPLQPLILDGEIIVFENGQPSFNGLQRRAQLKRDRQIAVVQKRLPAVFFAFDILHVGGINVRGIAYEKRRHYLAQCVNLRRTCSLFMPGWTVSRFMMRESPSDWKEPSRREPTAFTKAANGHQPG